MLYLFIVLVFALFIWIMIEDDKIAHIEVSFDGKYERHKVLPDSDLIDGVLTDSELDVLERVYKKLNILVLLKFLIIQIKREDID